MISRSFFLYLSLLFWLDVGETVVEPNPRLQLFVHKSFDDENDDEPIVGTRLQQDRSAINRKVRIVIVSVFINDWYFWWTSLFLFLFRKKEDLVFP